MSHWDGKQVIRFEPEPWPEYPGWQQIDCGCANGLEWGGEEPRECRTCKGWGFVALHDRSGALALYPGGPFCGVVSLPGESPCMLG